MLRRMLQVSLSLSIVGLLTCSVSLADEEPKGAFARGEKLPGDLSTILDGNNDKTISDAEVNKAIDQFQKEANARQKTKRGQAILDALDNNRDGMVDKGEAQRGAVAGRLQQGGNAQKVQEIFNRLDTDRNGFVTGQEYGKLIALVGFLKPDAAGKMQELFTALDTDRDRAISFIEAQVAADLMAQNAPGGGGGGRVVQVEPVKNPKITQFVDATFAQRDKNEDGMISVVEAKRDRNLKAEFARADESGDGRLTKSELYNYLQKKFSP